MTAMSRPSATPNATASLVATRAVAERKLLASFIACAEAGPVADAVPAVAEPGEHRLDMCARVVVGRVHHRERAGARAGDATRHRRVDVGDPAVGETRVDGAEPRRRPTVDVSTTWVVIRSSAVASTSPRDRFRRGAVGQAAHDDVGRARDVGDGVDVRDAIGRTLGAGGVVADDGVSRAHEVGGERAPHVAEPDETDREPTVPTSAPVPLGAQLRGSPGAPTTPAGPPAYATSW